MKYTVYRREFQMRTAGVGYFFGEVLVVVWRTNFRWLARIAARLKRASWTEGHVEAGMPPIKRIKLPLRLRFSQWRLQRALSKLTKVKG